MHPIREEPIHLPVPSSEHPQDSEKQLWPAGPAELRSELNTTLTPGDTRPCIRSNASEPALAPQANPCDMHPPHAGFHAPGMTATPGYQNAGFANGHTPGAGLCALGMPATPSHQNAGLGNTMEQKSKEWIPQVIDVSLRSGDLVPPQCLSLRPEDSDVLRFCGAPSPTRGTPAAHANESPADEVLASASESRSSINVTHHARGMLPTLFQHGCTPVGSYPPPCAGDHAPGITATPGHQNAVQPSMIVASSPMVETGTRQGENKQSSPDDANCLKFPGTPAVQVWQPENTSNRSALNSHQDAAAPCPYPHAGPSALGMPAAPSHQNAGFAQPGQGLKLPQHNMTEGDPILRSDPWANATMHYPLHSDETFSTQLAYHANGGMHQFANHKRLAQPAEAPDFKRAKSMLPTDDESKRRLSMPHSFSATAKNSASSGVVSSRLCAWFQLPQTNQQQRDQPVHQKKPPRIASLFGLGLNKSLCFQ